MVDPASVEQFISITGADTKTAEFFLSAAHDNCDAAVSAFFESGGMIPPGSNSAPPSRPSRPTPSSSRPSSSRPAQPSAPSSSRRAGGVATLGSLRGSNSDDDESGKNYYAGGEKSGQMIQDPRKRGGSGGAGSSGGGDNEPQDLAEAIFERARARGPRTDEERAQFASGQNFTGAGYRLGDEENGEGAAGEAPVVVGRRNITRNLTFYANGFQIDEGPLRRFDDPQNEAFLSDVNRGIVPREMEEPGVGDVSITLIDKKGEDYVAPKKKMVPFSGGGQRLSAASASGDAAGTAPTARAVDTAGAAAAVAVDESRPMASVQVRLSDGTRLIARLNDDSTVGDLRSFVAASRPGMPSFTLSTSFPKKVLEDDSATLKEAQLKGAVVLQTLK